MQDSARLKHLDGYMHSADVRSAGAGFLVAGTREAASEDLEAVFRRISQVGSCIWDGWETFSPDGLMRWIPGRIAVE